MSFNTPKNSTRTSTSQMLTDVPRRGLVAMFVAAAPLSGRGHATIGGRRPRPIRDGGSAFGRSSPPDRNGGRSGPRRRPAEFLSREGQSRGRSLLGSEADRSLRVPHREEVARGEAQSALRRTVEGDAGGRRYRLPRLPAL